MPNTPFNEPGLRSLVESDEIEIFFNADHERTFKRSHKVTVDDESTDAGNTPTSTIRGGLLASLHRSSGNAYIYDADANDGRQNAVGVFHQHVPLDENFQGTNTERMLALAVGGNLQAGKLIGDFDLQGRKQLQPSFQFDDLDDTPPNTGTKLCFPAQVWRHATDYTVLTKDDGGLLIADGAAAVNFTLPTIAAGLQFKFYNAVDYNMVITGAASSLVGLDTAGSTSCTYSTASELIGACCLVTAVYLDAGLKWLVENIGTNTQTFA